MKRLKLLPLLILYFIIVSQSINAQDIPLAEHPRPDFQRELWDNLNGNWSFEFDTKDVGIQEKWFEGNQAFDKDIVVPFPWGSKLSGVKDEADIGWYQREISVDPSWQNKRTFLTIGASDWETTVWLDGVQLGSHQGGYVPFSFELTELIKYGSKQKLVIRVDDKRRDFALYGKQGYGNARGIWQTVYLEARGNTYLENIHFTPDIDNNKVRVKAYLPEQTKKELDLSIKIKTDGSEIVHTTKLVKDMRQLSFDIDIPDPHLWNLDDPYLYEVEAVLEEDKVNTYFGMRKISVVDLPGTDFPYIALNDEPIYVQLALDQSYHPEGFYTFPSDQFMKDEILRSKSIGLNGIRIHIKVEVPRKLYWADKLGLLVMEDLPNSWGEPEERMQIESEYTLREMIKRDYNHPSIFSWVIFNETWGLNSITGLNEEGNPFRAYTERTQDWVVSMYYLAKSLDPSRLVEDNSICCGRGHTETDINSWHQYLPGYEWDTFLKNLDEQTYEGSEFHFESRFRQGKQPNINSECGNVWGYDGSAGDGDWSWDYHRMLNSFRMHPKIGGWLYTEHHDVINEWNGYWRYDRSEKETGLGEIVEGMSLNDLHAPVYISTGNEICKTVKGGEKVEVPLHISVMTGTKYGQALNIQYDLSVVNRIGEKVKATAGNISLDYTPWMQKTLDPLTLKMPDIAGLAKLQLFVTDMSGKVLSRNFMHFEIDTDNYSLKDITVLSTPAKNISKAEWSLKQWSVLDGKKQNGAGKGYFEYQINIPDKYKDKKIEEAYFMVEASAKQLFVKDMEDYQKDQDFMLGSKVAPSANPNSYPMTDEDMFPSQISISINGKKVQDITLADDPADHRGILSWHHQLEDRKLREAGSYGYLIKVQLSDKILEKAVKAGKLKVRIETVGDGGIAIYGRQFGRYPLDPSMLIKF